MLRIKELLQRGDTIVEVLIAISIASLVLATAYATTARSMARIQDTQEHSKALKLVESQVEYLRSRNTIESPNTCFDTETGDPATACDVGTDPTYHLNIAQPGATTPYVITATWTTIQNQQSVVTVYYRP